MANEVENSVACKRCNGTGRRRTLGGLRRCACTPAPPKERGPRSATHEGECGFCERRFTIDRETKCLALHGFQRPGSGWLIGDCPGSGNLPAELSTVTMELLRDRAHQRVEAEESTLASYRSGSVAGLLYRVPRPDAPIFGRGEEHYEFVTVRPGDLHNGIRGIPSFESLLAQKIREAEISLRRMRDSVSRAIKRIAEWKPQEPRAL